MIKKIMLLGSGELGKEFVNSSFLESLTQKISRNRREFLDDYGVEIPKVNIIDSVELGEWEYEIRVSGVPVQQFSFKEGCFLAFDFAGFRNGFGG